MPALEVAAHSRHGSGAFVGSAGGTERPRVRLGLDLLDTVPADRAWTIAHELSYVLRRQEGTRLKYTRGPLTLAGLLTSGSVAAPLVAAYAAVRGSGPDVGLLLALGAFGM